jgi:putative oxidoreductase
MLPTTPKAVGWLTLPCRLILGGLFVFAGVLKLGEPQAFADAIKGFKIFTDAREFMIPVMTFVLPWTEIIAGSLLILGLWARGAAMVIVGMLLAFVAGVVSVVLRDIDTKCSCFGKIEWPCTGGVGWCQVIRNSVMIAMAVPIFVWGPGPLAIDRESKA